MDKEILLLDLTLNFYDKMKIRDLLYRHNINEIDQFTYDLTLTIGSIMTDIESRMENRINNMYDDLTIRIDDLRDDLDNRIDEVKEITDNFYRQYHEILSNVNNIDIRTITDEVTRLIYKIKQEASISKEDIVKSANINKKLILDSILPEIQALNEVLGKINEYLERQRPVNLRVDNNTPADIRNELVKSQLRIGAFLRRYKE